MPSHNLAQYILKVNVNSAVPVDASKRMGELEVELC